MESMQLPILAAEIERHRAMASKLRHDLVKIERVIDEMFGQLQTRIWVLNPKELT